MNQQEIEFYQRISCKDDDNQDKSIRMDDMENLIGIQQQNKIGNVATQSSHSKKQSIYLWITILIGIVFHIIFAKSIFDVYIQSWKAVGVTPVESLNAQPLAKRVIMIQLDGARADTFYEYQSQQGEPEIGKPRVPFVHELIKNGTAAFGVSHASVPTESRSCVQTMMGGYYEDMTAILSGWANAGMQNDRVYNYVQAGWFFGPLMLQGIFDNSPCPQCVRKNFYPDSRISYVDFQKMKDLDDFTFDELKTMFNGTVDSEPYENKNKFDVENLSKDKIMVYANLIGTDASGQGFKPTSWQYRENMRRDGEELQKVLSQIEHFYNYDNQTTFIITSDHGMADIGAHGDGDPQNTRTPFVIWGAGIQPAKNEVDPENPQTHDDFSKPWKLNTKQRFDITQNQISSLISNILGIPIPTNNEGIIPLEFLNATSLYKTNALLQNAKQLAGSYQKLEEEAQKKQKWFFTTYKHSSSKMNTILNEIQQEIQKISSKSNSNAVETEEEKKQYKEILDQIYTSIKRIQNGKEYIMLYLMGPLQITIGLGYLGFMAFCLISITRFINTSLKGEEQNQLTKEQNKSVLKNVPITKIITTIVTIIVLVYLVVTEAPYSYYAYFGFPIFFFYMFFSQISFLTQSWNYSNIQMIGIIISMAIAGISLTYSFFDRNFISYIFICLAIVAVIYNYFKYKELNNAVINWSVSCVAISIFPLLPVIEQRNDLHYFIGFIIIVVMLFIGSFVYLKNQLQTSVKIMTVTTVYSGVISLYISNLIKTQQEVPNFILLTNWFVLFCLLGSIFILDLHSKSHVSLRFYSLIVIVSNVFLLFGIAHDVIFVAVFAVLLKSWISYEQYQVEQWKLSEEQQTKILPHHFFFAFKLILLMNTSFFGTGNMISISSFNMSSVDRFIINLREFIITALVLFKLCQPFLATSAAFICICKSAYQKINTIGLFLLSLTLVEIMTLLFFFMVRTQGTWQEKGSSVARFVISSLLILTYTILFILSLLFFKRSTGNNNNNSIATPAKLAK